MIEQTHTSQHTSRKQVAALLKRVAWIPGTRNLDYGGGKWDLGTAHLATLGVENLVYDPYNRTPDHNSAVLERLFAHPPDSVTLANVLNVIREREIRLLILERIRTLVKPRGTVLIACYRGEGDTPGVTRDGWQENRPLSTYLPEVREAFPDAALAGGIIVARA
jgi:hypothetical protein